MSSLIERLLTMDQRRSGLRPTLAGRNAKPTEQAKENI